MGSETALKGNLNYYIILCSYCYVAWYLTVTYRLIGSGAFFICNSIHEIVSIAYVTIIKDNLLTYLLNELQKDFFTTPKVITIKPSTELKINRLYMDPFFERNEQTYVCFASISK